MLILSGHQFTAHLVPVAHRLTDGERRGHGLTARVVPGPVAAVGEDQVVRHLQSRVASAQVIQPPPGPGRLDMGRRGDEVVVLQAALEGRRADGYETFELIYLVEFP